MKRASTTEGALDVMPPIHVEFIENQLANPDGSGGEEVEKYHRALFLRHHAVEWETQRQAAKVHEERLVFLQAALKKIDHQLETRTSLVPPMDGQDDTRPMAPWNAWDITMFAACLGGIVCLMTFGVWNISFNLLESGLVTFRDNPLRPYLWAALLPAGALAIKLGWDMMENGRKRTLYVWACLLLGMLGVIVWIGAYACIYPTLSKGIDAHIATLTVFGDQTTGLNFAGAKWVDVTTVAAQAVAEIFLSALMGIYLTTLYARHWPVRLARDAGYAQLIHERETLEESIARERRELGEATGIVIKLENELAALVAYGRSMFHREAAKRKDQSEKRQVILDELSDHLRTHLERLDPGNRLVTAGTNPPRRNDNGT
jgi:hypothetical protein